MNSPLVDARVVLGVTGSIACYKAADLASKLMQEGARVDVILTRGASNFVTPLTFRSLTHRPVVTDLFDADSEQAVNHVAMAHEADVVLVAPATAHVLAKLAHGFADDALTTTALASAAPLVVAPAMDGYMFDNPATQENPRDAATPGRDDHRAGVGAPGLGPERHGAYVRARLTSSTR